MFVILVVAGILAMFVKQNIKKRYIQIEEESVENHSSASVKI